MTGAIQERLETATTGRPRFRLSVTILARLLAVLFSIAVPVLLLEAGFRLFGPFLPGDYMLGIEREFDPVLGWRHRPNFVGGVRTSEFAVRFAINSHGLRDEEISYESPPGEYRVLALGDSFLAGAHVSFDQLMTKQLQGMLQQTLPSGSAEVVNAGVAGYGTAQEYLYFDREGYKYSPDLIMVVVFLGNDLMDNIRSSEGRWERPAFEVDGDGRLVQTDQPARDPARRAGWDDYLLRYSTVYNFVQSGVFRKLDQGSENTGEGGREVGQDFQIYERRPSAKLRRSWEVTQALLGAIARRGRELGAHTIVVGGPSYRQLDPARFQQMLVEEGVDPSRYDVELPSRLLGEAAAREGLPYLDLLPALRAGAASGAGDMFYPHNTHWAPAGQRVVAQTIASFIDAQGLAVR
jgi:hypothetical protein